MKLLLERLESMAIEECIIVAARIGDGIVFAKNRDRMYVPEVRIVRDLLDGVEVAYLEDMITGWREGMNEFGIGVINTALMVANDEKEKKMVKKTGEKSKEGIKILSALKKKNLKDAVSSLMENKVLGHTFVGNGKEVFAIEGTSKHQHVAKKLDTAVAVVRTNHGDTYNDAGYIGGDDFYSSKVRRASAERAAEDATSAPDMLRLMRKKTHKNNSGGYLNMMRQTPKMNTTSQLAMDLAGKKMYFNALKGKVIFKGIEDQLPEGYNPKIEIITTELLSKDRSE